MFSPLVVSLENVSTDRLITVCPNCSNILPIDSSVSTDGMNCFACRTCPYKYKLGKKLVERLEMPRKKLAEAVGAKEGYDDTAEGMLFPVTLVQQLIHMLTNV